MEKLLYKVTFGLGGSFVDILGSDSKFAFLFFFGGIGSDPRPCEFQASVLTLGYNLITVSPYYYYETSIY